MKDSRRRELQVGDFVAYVKGKNMDAAIATGHVTKIYKGYYGDECSVGKQTHIRTSRVMKLDGDVLKEA